MRESRSRELLYVAIVLALVGILLIGSNRWSWSRQEVQLFDIGAAQSMVALRAGETLSQTFTITEDGTYAGVKVFVWQTHPLKERLTVTVRDEQGQVLASGSETVTALSDRYEHTEVSLPVGQFEAQRGDRLTVELALLHGEQVGLRATAPVDDKPAFSLAVNGQDLGQDVAMALLKTAPLSFGAQQGIAAAAMLVLGLLLLQFFPVGRSRWLAAGVLLVLVTPLALMGYWYSDGPLGIADWDYYFSLHHHYRTSIIDYGVFPLWNPYTCGGTAGLGDPEFPGLTLTFLAELVFGIEAGVRLAIWLAVAVGAVGFLLWAKRLAMSPRAAVLVAMVGALGSVNLLEITEGHVNVFAAMWIPWIFWSWLGVYRGRTRPLVCGLFLALTFLQGGIYLLMYTALAFLVLPWLTSKPKLAILVTIKSSLWAGGLAAVKIVPVLFWLKQFPDDSYASSTYTLANLTDILFGRYLHGANVLVNQQYGWHEYGAYIGYAAFALALVGLVHWRRLRVVRALVVATVLAVLLSATGPALEPIFDIMWFFPRSNISRLILFGVIPLALLAGYGLDNFQRRIAGLSNGKQGRFNLSWLLTSVVIGIVAAELFSLSYQISEQAFVLPRVIPAVEQAPAPISFRPERFDPAGAESRTSRTYEAARQGWGTFAYCSVLGPAPMVSNIYDEIDNEYLSLYEGRNIAGPETQATVISWSPNRVVVQVEAAKETIVVINTNYAQGWRVNGQAAVNPGARVGTTVQPGRHLLVFSYHPPGLRFGLLITLITVSWIIWRQRRVLGGWLRTLSGLPATGRK